MRRAFFAFLIFLLYQVMGSGIVLLCANWDKLTGSAGETVTMPSGREMGLSMLIAVVPCIVLLYAAGFVRRRPYIDKNWKTFSAAALLLAGLFLIVSLGTSLVLSPLNLPDGGQTTVFEGMATDPVCLLLLVVVGPVFEELVFREGIVRSLFAKGWSNVAASAVAALLFAVVHGNLAQGVPAFVLGLVLGLVYVASGDVRVTAVMHIANNALAVLFMLYPGIEEFLTPEMPEIAVFIGILLILVAGFFIYVMYTALTLGRDQSDPGRLWAKNNK